MTSGDNMGGAAVTVPAVPTTGSMNGATPMAPEETPSPLPRLMEANGKNSPSAATPAPVGEKEHANPNEATATRSLVVVLRALQRHQARSVMLERVALLALEEFRGTEVAPPRKLLRFPNGIRFAVEPTDAEEIYLDLRRMAGEERLKMLAIHAAAVEIAPSAVDISSPPYVPDAPCPPEEYGTAVDNPGHRAGAAPAAPKSSARGGTATASRGKPDEWEQAVGASDRGFTGESRKT
jgi:hypothetical protein